MGEEMSARSSDDGLGLPAEDELWPARPVTPAGDDHSTTIDADPSDVPNTESWGRASAAPPVTPIRFPLAPPIPPLSFIETPSQAVIPEVPEPLPPSPPPTPYQNLPVTPLSAATLNGSGGMSRSPTLRSARLDQLLRSASARGMSPVYLRSQTPVCGRVNGELEILEGTPTFGSDEIETLLTSLRLAHYTDARRLFAASEWTFDLADVGCVRCTTFTDHRGAGAVFEIAPFRIAAVEQFGMSLDVQLLAAERDGLVIVAGPRASGALRLMHQLAHTIVQSRRAYVVAVQRGLSIGGNDVEGFISHREVRTGLDEMLTVARAALRENPDVLVLEEARSAPLMNLALDAAASGQLVIAGFSAPTAIDALKQIVDLYPSAQARSVQRRLAQDARAIVGQVLVPKVGGGRIAAQEVLPMTPAVRAVLCEVDAWQLDAALTGAASGMVPLADVLVDLVRTGDVRPEDAYRGVPDRMALLERFEHHGIDTSFAQA